MYFSLVVWFPICRASLISNLASQPIFFKKSHHARNFLRCIKESKPHPRKGTHYSILRKSNPQLCIDYAILLLFGMLFYNEDCFDRNKNSKMYNFFFNSAENVSSHRLTPLIAAVLCDPLKTPITSAYDWPIRKAFLLETVKHSL